MRTTTKRLLGIGLLLALSGSVPAAEPPALVNYQGVLRDSEDTPLTGAWHTIFRFFSAETGGDEILIDERPNGSEREVLVSGGLFNVALGSGDIFDGSGPGVYGSLSEVFRDYGTVWMEVEIDGEVLTPRVRVLSSAYALNADHLDGRAAGEFIDTSSAAQVKTGPLTVTTTAAGEYGVRASGSQGGGRFENPWGSGSAELGVGEVGIKASANNYGGMFWVLDGSGHAEIAYQDLGIRGYGDQAGGYFENTHEDGYAYVGASGYGIVSRGMWGGGSFQDLDQTSEAYIAFGNYGVQAEGNDSGGDFQDRDDSGRAYVGHGDYGIWAQGNTAGGYFEDGDDSGHAFVGDGNRGIWAYGSEAGGYFEDSDGSGHAYVGNGGFGIKGYGDEAGGYFEDSNGSSIVWVGRNDNGISSYGSLMGGYFEDTDSGIVSRVAYGEYGLHSNGTKSFVQNHPYEDDRVIVHFALEGDEAGTYTRGTGRLQDGKARIQLAETFQWVTNPDIGLTAHLTPRDSAVPLAVVSLNPREMVVTGPEDGPQEVAFDYIVHGLRIGFEELSPVREKEGQAFIPSMAPQRELYERSPGLRRFNALERFKGMAAETYGTDAAALDLSAAEALRAAIQEYDPEIHGRIGPDRPDSVEGGAAVLPEASAHSTADRKDGGRGEAVPAAGATPPAGAAPGGLALPVDEEGNVYGRSFRPSAGDLATMVEAAEVVEVGDVLVIDPGRPGLVGLAREAEDTAVFGIVAAEPGLVLGAAQPREHDPGTGDPTAARPAEWTEAIDSGLPQGNPVPVALSGIVLCKADAGYGEIRPGDLLTTSPTAGHAMRAGEPRPGTILGKALEPLDAGTGWIRILVTIR